MDYPAIILAGLVGGAAMTAVPYMGIFMMPAQMKINLLYMLGSMMFGVLVGVFYDVFGGV